MRTGTAVRAQRYLLRGALLTPLVATLVGGWCGTSRAQGFGFGVSQGQVDAVNQMIVLGVQQGISSLPPTSGQAFTYDFNDELGTFVESEQLGPTVLRSSQTIGANRLSVRFATSYFELGETFDPIVYQATGGPIPPGEKAYTSFGMSADANVVLFNLGATYGITDRIEATLNIPFSVVDARASEIFLTFPPPFPPASDARVAAVPGDSPAIVQQALDAGVVAERELSFNALGFDFNSGKQSASAVSVSASKAWYWPTTGSTSLPPASSSATAQARPSSPDPTARRYCRVPSPN